jgi:hypothetical protein
MLQRTIVGTLSRLGFGLLLVLGLTLLGPGTVLIWAQLEPVCGNERWGRL